MPKKIHVFACNTCGSEYKGDDEESAHTKALACENYETPPYRWEIGDVLLFKPRIVVFRRQYKLAENRKHQAFYELKIDKGFGEHVSPLPEKNILFIVERESKENKQKKIQKAKIRKIRY